METTLRVDLLTREYPPEVYGGAGVHLEYLARDLRRLADVRVHCFGAPRDEPGVTAYADPPGLSGANAALRTMGVDLEMAAEGLPPGRGGDGRGPGDGPGGGRGEEPAAGGRRHRG